MNTNLKIILILVTLSFLGLGDILHRVIANPLKSSVPTLSQQQMPTSQAQKRQTFDGDGEMDDATEPPEAIKSQQDQEKDSDEANEGPNDQDIGQKENAH